MTLRVVTFDMREVCRLFAEGGYVPVEVSHPLVEGGIATADLADVAFEVLDIY